MRFFVFKQIVFVNKEEYSDEAETGPVGDQAGQAEG